MGEGTRSGLWSECARLLGEIRPDYAIFENVTALLSGESGKWFERVLWDLSQVGYDAEWHCIPASELGANHHRDRVWIIAYPNLQRCKELNTPAKPKEQDQLSRKCNEGGDATDTNNERPVQRIITGVSGEKRPQPNDQPIKGRGEIHRRKEDVADSECESVQAQLSRKLISLLRETNKRREANRPSSQDSYIGGEWSVEPNVGRVANGIPDRTHRLKGLGNAICPPISELIGRAILEAENEAM